MILGRISSEKSEDSYRHCQFGILYCLCSLLVIAWKGDRTYSGLLWSWIWTNLDTGKQHRQRRRPSKRDWEAQRCGEVEALCRFEGAFIDLWRDPLRVARVCRREGLARGATGPTGVAFVLSSTNHHPTYFQPFQKRHPRAKHLQISHSCKNMGSALAQIVVVRRPSASTLIKRIFLQDPNGGKTLEWATISNFFLGGQPRLVLRPTLGRVTTAAGVKCQTASRNIQYRCFGQTLLHERRRPNEIIYIYFFGKLLLEKRRVSCCYTHSFSSKHTLYYFR